MGSALGRISEEQPRYDVARACDGYEVRTYEACCVIETTYDPRERDEQGKSFMRLAKYIGVLSKPRNARDEKIAMTAPVFMTPDATAATRPRARRRRPNRSSNPATPLASPSRRRPRYSPRSSSLFSRCDDDDDGRGRLRGLHEQKEVQGLVRVGQKGEDVHYEQRRRVLGTRQEEVQEHRGLRLQEEDVQRLRRVLGTRQEEMQEERLGLPVEGQGLPDELQEAEEEGQVQEGRLQVEGQEGEVRRIEEVAPTTRRVTRY